MSSLMNVESMTWMVVVGWAARAASMIGRTGSSSFRTCGFSPGILPTIRIADPSADVSPASGGALSGSMSSEKLAVDTPSTSAFAAPRALTRSPTVARKPGSVAAPGPAESTTTKRSYGGSDDPPAPKTSYAFWASTVSSFGFAARVEVTDPAHLVAQHEDADRHDEPEDAHRPAVAGAPHGDPDGRGLPGGVTGGGARRAIGRHGAWGSSDGGPGESSDAVLPRVGGVLR